MKKFSIVAALAIAISGIFASCGNTPAKANLKNDVDTLSYAIGMAQTQGLKQYLLQMDIDTTYIDEFVKGLNDGANAGDNKKKAAYYMGVQIGQQISNRMVKGINHEIFGDDSTKTISLKNFMAGFIQGVHGKGIMTIEQANQVAQQKMMAIKSKYMEEKYGAAKKKGEEWMAANAKKEGVKTLPSGLQYKVLTAGTGEVATKDDNVTVRYEGKTIDGNIFDSSYKRNPDTSTFRPDQVIKGWTEALTSMPAGSTWMLYIPQELAYGSRAAGQIKPYSTLIFKVELVKIDRKQQPVVEEKKEEKAPAKKTTAKKSRKK